MNLYQCIEEAEKEAAMLLVHLWELEHIEGAKDAVVVCLFLATCV